MKINFEDYDLENFLVRDISFCGIDSKLIQPQHIGTKFTQKNKIFRSSIWDVNGNLLSAGLPKFVNFSENPENFPVPTSLDGCKIVEKLDGSLCIVDFFNNLFSARTRGTSTYKTLENFSDFDYCFINNPKIEQWIKRNYNYTLLFEITTPNLKIVLDYGESPQLWLVGCIDKNDYSLKTQSELDIIAKEINVLRPKYYSFNNVSQLLEATKDFKNLEGVCLYSKNDQEIHKIKSDSYLKLHYFKSNATFENTLDLYLDFSENCDYNSFEKFLVQKFDYECFELVRGFVSKIFDSKKEVADIVKGMVSFISKIKNLSRKEQANQIISSYGNTNRSSFVFILLDGKKLTKEMYKKLYFQVTKFD